ncbi:LuxR C-terminal-related transcriptional regulator [Cellulomonas dongxiuzhuiae]|uniref:LuxR C-terminal-related transcriptional regulator n=1 Tax=Cellulomonas dongxiuzhuiae TaxID=2819979 RepID=UPI001AAF3C2B|nr:LuxR C-terminal-related transcriptional regulator [Cellulomonas dongxiuzhuiae]MBO3093304.1 hypothetical protein [Cellulomonas dongxiuzhuiae]
MTTTSTTARGTAWRTSVPPAARTVERPRARAALHAAVELHPVVVVTAPAGFGKTTLLAQWAAAAAVPVAWASLDAFDDEPGRLLRAVGDAVARTSPGAAAALAAGRGTPSPTPGDLLDTLRGVLGALDEGTVVVLDDIHRISSPAARHAVSALLQTPGPRFVLAGRHVPDLALGARRIEGAVGDLGVRTLALTPRETELLVGSWGPAPAPGVVAELWRVTGGWPTAVRAAWRAGLLHRGHPQRPLRHEDVPVADYVREEVLGDLGAELDAFVRRACVGRVVEPALAEAMVPGGAALLDECVARGLLGRRDEDTGAGGLPAWHVLLAAHVRGIVARTQPRTVRAVHQALARHLAGPDPAAAVRHAVDGHAPDLAAELLVERWPELLARGQLGATERRCVAMGVVDGAATVSLVGRTVRAQPGPEEGDAAAAAVVRALRATSPAPAGAGREQTARGATAGPAGTVLAYLTARAALHAPDVPAAGIPGERCGPPASIADVVDALADAADDAAVHGWPVLALACRAEHALACARAGRVAEARAGARGVLVDGAAHGWDRSHVTAPAHLAAGLAAYWCDEPATARHELTAAVEAGASRPGLVARAACVLLHLSLADGDPAGVTRALAVVEDARAVTGEPSPPGVSRGYLEAVSRVAQGGGRDALALADPADPAWSSPAGSSWRSDVHRRAGDRGAALRALGDADVEPSWHVADRVAAHAARALLHVDAAQAHRSLERALDDAATDGVVRPLRDRAAALRPLLAAHLGRGSAHEALVTRLLVAEQDAPAPRPSAWALTERELQVLACLPSHMTVEEIGGALFVSVNTVKTHLRAVYRKLDVSTRRDAVHVAVQRGLL